MRTRDVIAAILTGLVLLGAVACDDAALEDVDDTEGGNDLLEENGGDM